MAYPPLPSYCAIIEQTLTTTSTSTISGVQILGYEM